MLRVFELGGKASLSDSLIAGQGLTIKMQRATGMKNRYYDFYFTVNHDNALAITCDTFSFAKNLLQGIKFETGAGDSLFDLTPSQMLLLQLKEEGRLRYSIDKTAGTDKTSTFMIRWSFELTKDFFNPLDTVFHSENLKYNVVQIKMKPQRAFDSITDCTVNTVDVRTKQVFKLNPTPKAVNRIVNGKVVKSITPALNKRVKVKDVGFNSTVSGHEVELPTNTSILGFFAYVVDENEVVKSGAITNISIKNGGNLYLDTTFDEANQDNRDMLQTWSNALYNDVAYIDIAQGQLSESLVTSSAEHANTHLEFDLVASAGTNILKIMYLTIEDA